MIELVMKIYNILTETLKQLLWNQSIILIMSQIQSTSIINNHLVIIRILVVVAVIVVVQVVVQVVFQIVNQQQWMIITMNLKLMKQIEYTQHHV